MDCILKYISNFSKRAILYQAVLTFAAFKLLALDRSYLEFRKNCQANLYDFIFKDIFSEDGYKIMSDKTLFTGSMYVIIIYSSISILNIPYLKISRFFCAWIAFVIGVVYFNPLPHFRKMKGMELDFLDYPKFLPSSEFILYMGLSFGILAHLFKDDEDEENEKPVKAPENQKSVKPKSEKNTKETPKAPEKTQKNLVEEDDPKPKKKKKKKFQ